MTCLRVKEIFYSLQGETNTVGIPTVFVRLTGCPLRCQYCDTAYAFHGGDLIPIANILTQIEDYKTRYVTVTGGEPLAQKNTLLLLRNLCDRGYKVSLETSGALDVSCVDKRVVKILDIKTPGSQEHEKNRWDNLPFLTPQDEVKFVLCNRDDYLWAKQIISKFKLHDSCSILFSPSYNEISAACIAEWILEDQLPVRLQIQLHKYLWGDVPGR